MSLFWRMEREEKPVYMEDGKIVSLYVVAFEREGGSMATIPQKADEELWYLRIVKHFSLLRDEDLSAQPPSGAGELSNLGIGPEKKKCAPTANITIKKTDTAKAQSSKVKNVKGEKKGTRHSSDSWCDYVVVPDSLEGLVPVVVRKPKAEPRDAADIPASNADDPIDLESSPEPFLRTKTGKIMQAEVDAEAQPAKKVQKRKITRRGNLDAFIAKPPSEKPTSPIHAEPSSAVNEELPPSPLHAPISELLESSKAAEDEAEKTIEAENPEVEKPVEVEMEKTVDPETTDVDATHPKSPEVMARDPEKGKFVSEDPVITITSAPVNVEENPAGDQGGTFPPTEIKFQEDRDPEQGYHAYLEEAATYTSTTHLIVREWHSMHKEWAAFEVSKKTFSEDEARVAQVKATLEADRAKFKSDLKTEEWSVVGWKRKAEAEAALLSKERKNWREICEKDNNEKIGLRNIINNLKAEVERLKK
ncbi:hypothetical protein HanPI659440_Chr12g0475021 [Helianthus annuus]|nr:hypothetical protein HanPI659440_Chr12g0475021 [Helianthus annuus]